MKKMKQKQQAWKVEIEAKKADGLAFGLKATKALPPPATAAARKLFRFSLRLKLSSVVIHVKSKHKPSVWPNPLKFFKSKFAPKFSDKFRGRTIPAAAAKTTLNIPPPPRWKAMTIIKGWDCCGGGSSSASLQNLYLLRQSISQKDQNGIVLQLAVNVSGWTGPIRYVASSVFENDAGFGRKLSIILVLLLLVTVFISPSLRCASSLSVGGAFGILQSLGIRIKSFQLNVRSFAVENSDGLIFR
ncbi:uncharacterized protein LOC113775514 [Coffea eugenioides]|uniref:uncharacterized protein LOC113775514 n=1 Tax=Coffea eugenioides TaxID=49369 RepID=UPI000F60A434|nr:uncharacterized protein LOC113775514 [Coffea eugenioides]